MTNIHFSTALSPDVPTETTSKPLFSRILFSISSANLEKYKDHLSPGQVALLKKYPDYKLNIYPTRRSGSAPERVYKATRDHATTATLVNNGNGIDKTIVGKRIAQLSTQANRSVIERLVPVGHRGQAIRSVMADPSGSAPVL